MKPIWRGEVINVAIDGLRHQDPPEMLFGSLVGCIGLYTRMGSWGGERVLVFGGEMGVVKVGMRYMDAGLEL